jgi:hypothetical protein
VIAGSTHWIGAGRDGQAATEVHFRRHYSARRILGSKLTGRRTARHRTATRVEDIGDLTRPLLERSETGSDESGDASLE